MPFPELLLLLLLPIFPVLDASLAVDPCTPREVAANRAALGLSHDALYERPWRRPFCPSVASPPSPRGAPPERVFRGDGGGEWSQRIMGSSHECVQLYFWILDKALKTRAGWRFRSFPTGMKKMLQYIDGGFSERHHGLRCRCRGYVCPVQACKTFSV